MPFHVAKKTRYETTKLSQQVNARPAAESSRIYAVSS